MGDVMGTGPQVTDSLEAGRDALARHDWRQAYDLLNAAMADGKLHARDLENLAEAAFWTGHAGECLQATERAYASHVEQGELHRAGLAALRLAREYQHRLAHSVAAGWFSRARSHLEQNSESHEYGYLVLAMVSGEQAKGNLDRALELAREATEIGMQFEDRDLQALGRHKQAIVLLARGDVDAGRALLDEATMAAVAGELGTMTTAIIYCNTISACRQLADYRRAGEWTEAATRWCEDQAVAGFPGVCRIHRAEVMRSRGAWSEAEGEVRRACEELRDMSHMDQVGEGFYQIGEIRLRFGDLAGAEEAFRQAHELGVDPQPGLALLWLAEGKVEAAAMAIRRSLEDESCDRLSRARLLPARVEIALALGDSQEAHVAAEELEAIAKLYDSSAIDAAASFAQGLIRLEEHEPEVAIRHLKRAFHLWRELDMPYDAARSRMLLGSAYRAQGDEEAAGLEFQAARSAFMRLGAVSDSRRVGELLGEDGSGRGGARATHATRTFMFTDIVDSTKLVEAIGDEAWTELLHWHDETLRSLFAAHGGTEINRTGDGFFVGFKDVLASVDCAVAIQRTLAEHRRAHGFAPQVRIGLHGAEAVRRGLDYGGKGVHEAARISALAGPGEILVSRESLSDQPSRYRVSEAREVILKGISEPIVVVSIDWK